MVFLSSASGTGDLGSWPEAGAFTGLDAADAICRNLANAAGYKSVSGQLGYSTVFWIGMWTKVYGSKEANRIMKDTE